MARYSLAAVVITTIGTFFLILNLFYARKSVDAANAANKLNREHFLAERRPWLKVETVEFIKALEIIDGAARTTVRVTIKNVGQQVARAIRIKTELHLHGDVANIGAIRDELLKSTTESDLTRRDVALFHQKVLFPGSAHTEEPSLFVPSQKVVFGSKNVTGPDIWVVVNYRGIENQPMRTVAQYTSPGLKREWFPVAASKINEKLWLIHTEAN